MELGPFVMRLIPKSVRRALRESLRTVLQEEIQTVLSREFARVAAHSLDLEGVVDHCDAEIIVGWAWDRTRPNVPIAVEIWDGDTLVDTVWADGFRQDLYEAGKGDGRHAFTYVIPHILKDGQPHSIHVRFSPKAELAASPRLVTLAPSSLENPLFMHMPLKDFVGDGPFKEIGEAFLTYFVELAGLQPHERVLEIGCGIGRMAIPLTGYLNRNGRYEGMDISKTCIDWCRENITPKHPNFHFVHADLFNKSYNPNGKYQASQYRFPYDDQSFDFIFLTSVFTHMLPADMDHYFSEIHRLLKAGGRTLTTYFLLNPESRQLIRDKKARWELKFNFGHYRVENINVPEAIVAYDESFIRHLYEKHGFQLMEPVHYGAWCGRQTWLSGQDIVLATKH